MPEQRLTVFVIQTMPDPAQTPQDQANPNQETTRSEPDLILQATTRAEVIDGVLKSLNDSYVFPEIAKKMEKSIRATAA
jgi:hypothetical protein